MIHTIDARGLACPKPVILAKKAMEETLDGSLQIIVDNEIAVTNLMKLGEYLKVEANSKVKNETEYEVEFILSESKEVEQVQKNKTKTVVMLTSDCMGSGDETLGKVLMKGFIYALTELEVLPETILCYNCGAKLTVQGSDSLEDFRLLEEQGVEILTCGTCLKHYGLEEKLEVGGVTNMYVIAEKLMKAETVIRP